MTATARRSPGSRPGRVAIVGAGLRGLASAVYLRARGHQVTVFEQASGYGGIWARVYDTSLINTPSHGYTFHASNRWSSSHPNRVEIMANLHRMVEVEGLARHLVLGTRVDRVVPTASGRWRVGDRDDDFDGVLACTGFLGKPRRPEPELARRFDGPILSPYAFDPAQMRDKAVAVVGSGATALEILTLAERHGARAAHLLVRPGTRIRDIGPRERLLHLVVCNPFLFLPIKRALNREATAISHGITPVLESPRVHVWRHVLVAAEGRALRLDDGTTLEVDALVWCTGWEDPTPAWARAQRGDPTMVVASCQRCLDTAGFGYGTSTAHARALDAVLRCGVREAFSSEAGGCACEVAPTRYGPHIVLTLIRYLARQPGGARLVTEAIARGLRSNVQRASTATEPWWVKATAFLNGPLGL